MKLADIVNHFAHFLHARRQQSLTGQRGMTKEGDKVKGPPCLQTCQPAHPQITNSQLEIEGGER